MNIYVKYIKKYEITDSSVFLPQVSLQKFTECLTSVYDADDTTAYTYTDDDDMYIAIARYRLAST